MGFKVALQEFPRSALNPELLPPEPQLLVTGQEATHTRGGPCRLALRVNASPGPIEAARRAWGAPEAQLLVPLRVRDERRAPGGALKPSSLYFWVCEMRRLSASSASLVAMLLHRAACTSASAASTAVHMSSSAACTADEHPGHRSSCHAGGLGFRVGTMSGSSCAVGTISGFTESDRPSSSSTGLSRRRQGGVGCGGGGGAPRQRRPVRPQGPISRPYWRRCLCRSCGTLGLHTLGI